MLRLIKYFFITVLILSCTSKSDKNKNASGSARGPMNVNAIVVKQTSIDYSIHSNGTIIANEEIELRSEIPGRVVSINFKEGQAVQKGTLLVKIYDEDLKAQQKKIKMQEALASVEESRSKILLEQKGISQQEYDIVLNKLNSLKADIDLLQSQISKTEIKAPFSGKIGLRYISEGSYVQPSTLLAVLQQNDPVKIEFAIPERYASNISEATEINFTTGQEKKYKAQVYATEQKINMDTRTLTVRARCGNPKGELIPGSFVKIDILLDKITNAIAVPSEAVVPVLGGQVVYTLKNGKAVSSNVVVGIRTEDNVQVLKGINENDTVITTGLMILRNGAKVKANVSGGITE